mgnify:CR=1 FL=1
MGNTVKFAVGAALAVGIAIPAGAQDTGRRSEEHTSELQSPI